MALGQRRELEASTTAASRARRKWFMIIGGALGDNAPGGHAATSKLARVLFGYWLRPWLSR